MPKINQLSPHVADLIAAGEVVERPGSVVKELLENAIDAGAQSITVEIQNGGMTFIRLTDDGCGMEPEDAKIAFLRHATSKIKEAADLAAIHTLGFRGEALAAISSVSKIDLLTRTADSPAGTSLHLEAGVITHCSEAGCPVGTTIIVRNLFYNTPARMKFMKSDTAEASNIFSAVQKQALAHPELSLRFIKDGQELLHTAGDGKLHSAIYSIWGRELSNGMLAMQSKWESIEISGFVSKPTVTRGNRNYQVFFVNGRYIKSRLLSAALEDAYQNQIMTGRMPACVLHITLPVTQVDVNVHPAKTEIRFLSEREVYDSVRFGVLAVLNRAPGRVEMRLPEEKPSAKPAQPALSSRPAPKAAPQQTFFQTMDTAAYQAFAATLEQAPRVIPSPAVMERVERHQAPLRSDVLLPRSEGKKAAERLSAVGKPEAPAGAAPQRNPDDSARPQPKVPAEAAPQQQTLELPGGPDYRVVGEVLDTYIIVEQADGILFIDKHAAHERILFEKLKQNVDAIMGQRLLAPLTYTPDQEEAAILLENRPTLLELGYDVEEFGVNALAIRQIPADIDAGDAVDCLSELAELLRDSRHTEHLRDSMLHTIACKAAIKAGWHTQARERDALVAQVLGREDLKYCPHGRPICIRLTSRQLEHQFKRA